MLHNAVHCLQSSYLKKRTPLTELFIYYGEHANNYTFSVIILLGVAS